MGMLEQKGIPARYAWHYYDLYQMGRSELKDKAFSRRELLEQDVRFKLKFYYAKNASYETAHCGTIKLVPSTDAINDLRIDYDHMRNIPEEEFLAAICFQMGLPNAENFPVGRFRREIVRVEVMDNGVWVVSRRMVKTA